MEIIGIEMATYEKTLKEIECFLDTVNCSFFTTEDR